MLLKVIDCSNRLKRFTEAHFIRQERPAELPKSINEPVDT